MKTRTLCTLAVVAALVGCAPTPQLIDSIVAQSMQVAAGATVQVDLVLTDEATDVVIDWEVEGGWISATDVASILFYAPEQAGTATLTATVDCGCGGSETSSIELTVVSWAIDSGVDELDLQLDITDVPFNSVSFAGPDAGWAVAGGEGFYDHPIIVHWDGDEWSDQTQDSQGHLHSSWAVADDDFWAVGGGGLSYHWDGDDWTRQYVPGGCVHGLSFLGDEDAWVTPAEGQPFMRRWTGGGLTDWESYSAPGSYGMSGVSTISDDFGFAVGNGGRIFEFDGDSWEDVDSPTSEALHNVVVLSESDAWAVGDDGTILRFDGVGWDEFDSPTGRDLIGLYALSVDSVWAVGGEGKIVHFDGEEWTELESPTEAELHSIHMFDAGSGWAVGHGGAIIRL
jgi:photosystem II stability/assembly factor-like uncharacterized protein